MNISDIDLQSAVIKAPNARFCNNRHVIRTPKLFKKGKTTIIKPFIIIVKHRNTVFENDVLQYLYHRIKKYINRNKYFFVIWKMYITCECL